jgi:sugar/nucleoside kinase (ribokinase family)
VDVIATCDESFIAERGLTKGSMQLLTAREADDLYAAMRPAREISGGSAANSMAGLAALGLDVAFIGQVAADQLGEIFAHDMTSLGVRFETPPLDDDLPTGRCLILVTPDAQRTMNTVLGAAQMLEAKDVDLGAVAGAGIIYLEGYLWDPAAPRAAMEAAIDAARNAGRKVAFTLSDSFCISRHRDSFLKLIADRRIDILFANEAEITELAGEADFDAAVAAIAPQVATLVVTRSEKGAIAVSGEERASVPAQPIERLVDTTGAGDLFAAGFLAGQARGLGLEVSLKLGAIAAAEVIQHYGARPEADLKALSGSLLG